MTIQREYNLPNCKLVVEGFAPDGSDISPRPLLSVVTHMECILLGQEPSITGGRSLLESLVAVVSHYAQEFLSGVPHPHHLRATPQADQEAVRLERIDADRHRLTITPSSDVADANGQATAPLQLDLKTVQLFDLVEALDQMLADQQTVPDIQVVLAPISRQYAITHEPASKRVVPIALGLTSLAAAAIALFFLPIPERRVEPEPTAQESLTDPTAAVTPGASPGISPTPAGVVSPSPSPEASPSPGPEVSPSPGPEVSLSPTTEASPSPETPASPSPEVSDSLDETLATDQEITDNGAIDRLQEQLRGQLDQAWTQGSDFPEELVYRVRVAENGDILGFRYMNQAAVDYANRTPLLDLQYNPTDNDRPEPSTEFRVVFTPAGAVQVSPWYGRP